MLKIIGILFGALAVSAAAAAQTVTADEIEVADSITVGDATTQPIDTNLNGEPVPADIGQIYIGNTNESADAITIDSGSNFPPGIAFRRYLGDPANPQVVTAGTQLGYLDFRGYSGGQFYNAASLDVVVDPMRRFVPGELMPTKMRFAVSDGTSVYIPMELLSNGRLELGAINGSRYSGPGLLGNPLLFVNRDTNHWATIFAARPEQGAGYALRVHTLGETANDYLIGASSGEGAGTFKFSVRGNGDVHVGGALFLGTLNVGTSLSDLATSVATAQATADAAMAAAASAQVTADEASAEMAYVAVSSTGPEAQASGVDATAVGPSASATGDRALAIGTGATSSGNGAMAFGASAYATTPAAMAFGQSAVATGNNAIVIGNNARGNGASSIALGDGTVASQTGSVALGSRSVATAQSATAVGTAANATRTDATAVGAGAVAEGVEATALGASAVAVHDGSTAVGANAATTAENQVTIGGAGSSVRIGDLAASTAAQAGPVDAVTVDANGTLGRTQVASSKEVQNVRTAMNSVAAVMDMQFQRLEGYIADLAFQLEDVDENASGGIAAAMAMGGTMIVPDSTVSVSVNASTYRGVQGFAGSVAAKVAPKVYVTGSIAGATKGETGGRVGFAFGL